MPSLWATDAWSGCCRGWGATGTSSTCHTTERTPHTSISSRDKDTAQSAPTPGPPPTPSTGACITCGTRHRAFSSMGLRSLPSPGGGLGPGAHAAHVQAARLRKGTLPAAASATGKSEPFLEPSIPALCARGRWPGTPTAGGRTLPTGPSTLSTLAQSTGTPRCRL